MSYVYDLALSQIPFVGPVLAKKLIAGTGSAQQVFTESPLQLKKIPEIPIRIVQMIQKNKHEALLKAEKELKFIEKNKIEILHYQSEHYPYRLKNIDDAPIILLKKGKGHVNYPKVLGIIGTRKNTHYGQTMCEKFISDLADHKDLLIVSGLAYGIDIISHKKCLDVNLPTFGVLGNGLANIYPPLHAQTAHDMMEHGGILTEFLAIVFPIEKISRNEIELWRV
jgi:DNA processing protein